MSTELDKLAQALMDNKELIVITKTAERRGDIARAHGKLVSPKFRVKRWYGSYHFKLLDRIILEEDFIALDHLHDTVRLDLGD